MDNAVLASKKERKPDGLTVKGRNAPRTFTTVYAIRITAEPIQGSGMSSYVSIKNVVAAVYEQYVMDRVKNVFSHADGERWIGRLGALMLNAVFEVGGFHLKKHLKKLFALEGAWNYAAAV